MFFYLSMKNANYNLTIFNAIDKNYSFMSVFKLFCNKQKNKL